MRLWSIHPKYLDCKGLTALWRESLLAKAVLENKTKGYKNHPQLVRFRNHHDDILNTINYYLSCVYEEAAGRGYNYNENKFYRVRDVKRIAVNSGQVKYEFEHLLKKLKLRDTEKYKEVIMIDSEMVELHPLFYIVEGTVENWEKV